MLICPTDWVCKHHVCPCTIPVGALAKPPMKLNTAMPAIQVDPQTYEVFADGQLLTCEPAQVLPMAQRYFLF